MTRVKGRIIRGVGGAYWVAEAPGEEAIAAKPRGLFRHKGVSPLPGDKVEAVASGDSDFPLEIDFIAPRSNQLSRPACANIDRLYLVFSCTEPEPDLMLLDKMLIVSALSGIDPVIIWTKEDLSSGEDEALTSQYAATRYPQLSSSLGHHPASLDAVAQDELLVLAGPSGTGKSTLLNALLDSDEMLTGSVSGKTGRGRHTTRHMELFAYHEGWLADTPGFTSLDLDQLGILPHEVLAGYPEFGGEDCRFQPCTHLHEPGCAVRQLVSEQPSLQPRYERYAELRSELEATEYHLLRHARARQEKALYTIATEAAARSSEED